MQFDERLALNIISKHDLSLATLATWKNRGRIPDRYASKTYEKPEAPTKKEKQMQQSIIDLLNSKCINTSKMCEAAKVSRTKVKMVLAGTAQYLSSQQIEAIAQTLKVLHKQLTKYTESKTAYAYKKMLNYDLLNRRAIFKRTNNMLLYQYLYDKGKGRHVFSDQDRNQVFTCYLDFINGPLAPFK